VDQRLIVEEVEDASAGTVRGRVVAYRRLVQSQETSFRRPVVTS
jgi:hypothetical protein